MTRLLIALLLLATTLVRADEAGHAESDTFSLEAAALLEKQWYANLASQPVGAPAAARTGIGALGKNVGGSWTSIISWTPHIPVSAASLPDGRILTFASNQRTTFPVGPEFTYAATWDPATGAFVEYNNSRHDMFCGGIVMLADGRVVVAGGRNTTVLSSIFDWRTNTWSALASMNDPRWYNTAVALPDGQVFTVTGDGGTNTAERWNAASGWTRLAGINWAPIIAEPGYITRWHPFLSVAPNGQLLHFGPTQTMHWVGTSGIGSVADAGAKVPGPQYPKEGAWVMFDEGRILVAGGGANTTNGSDTTTNGTSSKAAYIVDVRSGSPVVTSTGSMKYARQFANCTVLPNGEVIVFGGNTSGIKFSDAGAVLAPEIWNPTTGAWREVTDAAVPRTYHSLALLLKDGRVLSAGGGLGGNSADHRDGEVFTPPNLFNADGTAATRPVISSAPAKIGVGSTFTVNATAGLKRFTFIKLSALTHSVNTDLRFLELPFTETSAGVYQLTARNNLNVMTPGYWYLFALNTAGVHSVAAVVQVDPTNSVAITSPGSQSGPVGTAVSLQLSGTGPTGATLRFSATGLPAGLTISTSGLISGTPTATGSFNATVSVTDNLTSASTTVPWTIYTAEGLGLLKREWWLNVSGSFLSDLFASTAYPNSPSGADTLTSFETPTNWADNLAQRVRGYLRPTVSGQYRFWIASDDEGRLLLSTDNNPANATIIARVSSWADSRQWTKLPEQQSALITLQAGRSYYIEALMKEGSGGDNLAVAWAPPGTTTPVVIPGSALSLQPLVPNNPPTVTALTNRSTVVGSAVSLQVVASDPGGDTLRYSATGLPTGLSIGSSNGLITGAPTTAGTFNTVISVSDNVNPAVTTSFTWTVVNLLTLAPISGKAIAVGTTVNLTVALSGGLGVTYQWSFGDGTASTAPSALPVTTHKFANAGRFLVTVTAQDITGRIVTSSYQQAVFAPLTSGKPRASSSIVYETRTSASGRVWVVNPDNDSVSVFDTANNTRVAEITVGKQPEALAIAPDGRVWVANNAGASLSIISNSTLAVVQTVTLARGAKPYGIVFSPNGGNAWVVLEALGQVLKLNPTTGATVATINVGANPRHVSITGDSAKLLVSRFITPRLPGENTATITTSATVGAEVVNISTATNAVTSTIILQHSEQPDTSVGGRGIPNYLGAAVISPDGTSAWVPSKQDNIKRGKLRDNQDLTHDSAVRSIVSRINLATNSEQLAARVDFNDAGISKAAAFDPNGNYLYVAQEGGREVAVVDVWNKTEVLRFLTGRAPQGVVTSPDGTKLYVSNFMDRTISVHDLTNLQAGGNSPIGITATVSTITTERLSAQVVTGKRLFYDSRDERLDLQQYISCASCHDDGGHDGRVWDFTGFGEGLRNTITLKGPAGTGHGPVHWTGNFDEIQDFEGQIRHFAGGTGLMTDAQFNTGTRSQPLGDPKAGVSADLDALAAYLATLTTTDVSPSRNNDGSLTASAQAGKIVFANNNCASCHGGPKFTNSALNNFQNIGTILPSSGKRLDGTLTGFDIPTLRGLFATAPYLHDGRATTLEAAVLAHTTVSKPAAGTQPMTDLVNYLQSIDNDEAGPSLADFTVTISAPASTSSAFTVNGTTQLANFTDLALTDFVVTNGTASNLSTQPASSTFSLTITPTAAGTVTVQLPAGSFVAGTTPNRSSNTTSTSYTIANRAPTITSPGSQSTALGTPVSLQVQASDADSNPLTFTASGLPTGLTISASGLISGTPTAAGTFNASVSVSDGIAPAVSATFTWTVSNSSGVGQLKREWWLNIPGSKLADLTSNAAYPNNPSGSDTLTSFETPTDWAEDMGQRVRGYLRPTVSGQYRFWIASDDEARLILSTDNNPANGVIIATVSDWTPPRTWTWYTEQQSVLITLQAGRSYYIEALMKEGSDGDNLAVAWAPPGSTTPVVIPGSALSLQPIGTSNTPPSVTTPVAQSTVRGNAASLQIQANDVDGQTLSYSATDLPQGLSINPSSGLISGTVASTAADANNVSVSVSDGTATTTVSFAWSTTAPVVFTATLSSTSSTITTQTFAVNLALSTAQSNVTNSQFTATNATVLGVSGTGTTWVATLQSGTAGAMSVRWSNGSTSSNTLSLTYNPPATFAAKVNFQPTGAVTPNNYVADNGALYAARNGFSYGWNVSHTDAMRDRNVVADQRQDTVALMHAASSWEIAVPNGSYDVTVSVGDASEACLATLDVEGVSAWSNVLYNTGSFGVKTLRGVLVSDGRLTLSNATAADGAVHVNYVDIATSGAPLVTGRTNGLTADYYSGMNFEQLRLTRIDAAIDNNWDYNAPDARLPDELFSVRWHGCIVPRYTETYTFTTTSDDGVRLWVNNQLIIDNWTDHGESKDTGSIALTANVPVLIKMEFYENGDAAIARLEWQSATQTQEVVPNERLLINENGMNAAPYPETFEQWTQSGRGSGTDPLGDPDGDGLVNLLEYAFGSAPGSGLQMGEGLHIGTNSDGQTLVTLNRPAAVMDLDYTLEGSTDLRNWSTVLTAATVLNLGDGTQRLSWTNPRPALLRLRVTLTDGTTAVTVPVAVQRLTLNPGNQTAGVAVLRAPVFSGLIHNIAGALISLKDDGSLSTLLDADAKYYLEALDGECVGQRWDIASVSDSQVTLDLASANNSLPVIPAELIYSRVAIRPHITLADAFPPSQFLGSRNAQQAEQVLFFNAGRYENYWLMNPGNGSPAHWLKMSDASLKIMDGRAIPAGMGVMIKLPAGAASRNLTIPGFVRTNAFAQRLVAGHNLIAAPWPVTQSPATLGLTVANGFTGGTAATRADQLQLWDGDTTPGATTYSTCWLLATSSVQRWVASADATLAPQDNAALLPAHRAAFLKVQPATAQHQWLVPAPVQ